MNYAGVEAALRLLQGAERLCSSVMTRPHVTRPSDPGATRSGATIEAMNSAFQKCSDDNRLRGLVGQYWRSSTSMTT